MTSNKTHTLPNGTVAEVSWSPELAVIFTILHEEKRLLSWHFMLREFDSWEGYFDRSDTNKLVNKKVFYIERETWALK